jgi:hypothetical protein
VRASGAVVVVDGGSIRRAYSSSRTAKTGPQADDPRAVLRQHRGDVERN